MEYEQDHLKVRWLSEIPRCAFDCFYSRALDRGCVYSDFSCICLAIADLAIGADVKACISACPVNPDQRWAPSRILDFCDLVGEHIQLPDYLNQFAGFHRRANYVSDASYSDYGIYYSDFSSASFDSISTTDVYTQAATSPATPVASRTSSLASLPTSTNSTATTGAAYMSGSASSGLSTGAKAGIGVAVPVAFIIFGLFAFWYLRKKRAKGGNSAFWADNNTGTRELRDNDNTVGPISTSQIHPAEADSNTIHESGGKSVVLSKSPAAGTQTPEVYELSGNSAIQYPPPTADVRPIQSDPIHNPVHSSVDRRMFQNADISNHSILTMRERKSIALNNSSDDFRDTGSSPQRPQEDPKGLIQGSPMPSENADVPLSQLEAEIALIAEEKERLQQLQSLAEREAELKRQIMARKSVT